jgi:hypothetical protein
MCECAAECAQFGFFGSLAQFGNAAPWQFGGALLFALAALRCAKYVLYLQAALLKELTAV